MARKAHNKAGIATKNAILGAAKRLFSVHGYQPTSIYDIFEASGVTKGAFYHHFRTKEDLALELLGEVQREYEERLVRPVREAGSPRDQISTLLRSIVELNSQPDWCNCRLLMTLAVEMGRAEERLRAAVRQMQFDAFGLWRSLIEAGQTSGDIRSKWAAEALAQLVLDTLWGALQARKAECEVVDMKQVVTVLEDILLRGR